MFKFLYISAIKLTQIEKYRMRLKERDRRKQLARRYGLITAAAQSAAAATAAASTPGPKPSKSPYSKKRGSKEDRYCIYLAIKRSFLLSRMTTNN